MQKNILMRLSNYFRCYLVAILDELSNKARCKMTSDHNKGTTPLDEFVDDLHDVEMYLDVVFNNAGDPIFVKDAQCRLLLVNDAFCRMFGLSRDEIIGKTLAEEVPPTHREHFLSIDKKVLKEGKEIVYEETFTARGMPSKTILTRKNRFEDSKGRFFIVGIVHDITDRKHAEEKLKRAASVFTHADEGIIIADAAGNITEVNDAFSRITGYTASEVLGKNPRILQSGRHSPEFYAQMWATITTKGHWRGEIWNRRKNGENYAEMITISAAKNTAGRVQHYVSLSTDITTNKAYQEQLERIAHYDLLTNLPNRVLLADRLNQAMLHSQRRHRLLAVAFIDLDYFKDVNDTYGHNVGDELLIVISNRMKEALREGDTLARIGGDEFIAVMVDLEKVADSQPLLERLLKATANPVTLGDAIIHISASIGVTFYSQENIDAEKLISQADQAMYIAKQAGKNRYHLFDAAQHKKKSTT
jgi:diguanylate cyclase (GGDEF)-like protein/PAS domain S-box-containing protein